MPTDRPLDVLIHTRYSTDEQSQSSIDGQINSCQRFLTANLPRECRPEQVNVEIIREPEISGEIADRPGINQVWAGMRDHRWDVILAEESSRLYRHMTFASQFFKRELRTGRSKLVWNAKRNFSGIWNRSVSISSRGTVGPRSSCGACSTGRSGRCLTSSSALTRWCSGPSSR